MHNCKFCNKELERRSICPPCATSRRRYALRLQAVQYKGGKCQDCGYNKCMDALHFHHLDPSQKEFTISSGITRSWEKTVKELDKCVLICANCHSERHYIPPPDGYLEPTPRPKCVTRTKKEFDHGAVGKYRQGCRCQPCKTSHSKYCQKYVGRKDKNKIRAAQKRWLACRRNNWISEHAPCYSCKSTDNLQVMYSNTTDKKYAISRLWSLSDAKRLPELNKCVVVCHKCYKEYMKVNLHEKFTIKPEDVLHGHNSYLKRGCRCNICTSDYSIWRQDKYNRIGK